VTIVSRGRRVAAGPVGQVLASHDRGTVRVRVAGHEQAAALLTEAGMTVVTHPDHLVVAGADDPAAITEILAAQGLYVAELTPLTPDLESVFLDLTATVPQPGVYRQVDDSIAVPQ